MNLDLKICGITNLSSIKIAAENNICSLGFASNNLTRSLILAMMKK